MTKVSTVWTQQTRNISQQKLTIGWDLGDRNSWYCVLDEAGQIQLEQRVRTTAVLSDDAGDRDAFALDQSLAQPSWDTK